MMRQATDDETWAALALCSTSNQWSTLESVHGKVVQKLKARAGGVGARGGGDGRIGLSVRDLGKLIGRFRSPNPIKIHTQSVPQCCSRAVGPRPSHRLPRMSSLVQAVPYTLRPTP